MRENGKTEGTGRTLIREIIKRDRAKIHFVGVGGVSMYSLARLSVEKGLCVSGSDREDSPRLVELQLLGVRISIGHNADNVAFADLVVYSHAIADDNPEMCEARKRNIPTVTRAEYLGTLMLDYKHRIGVSGSHGKSTAVAMLDCIFSHAMMTPTTLSGSDLPIGEPYRIGGNSLLIYEACEYRDSFLSFSPTDFVGLNLELDHTDYFDSLDSIKASFTRAMSHPGATVFINSDDANLKEIAGNIDGRLITFGTREGCDYLFSPVGFTEGGMTFSLSRFGSSVGSFELNIPGVHNLNNAAAAITVAVEYGLSPDLISYALSLFRGIPRRMEYIGSRLGRPIYYDYAHHPTEICAAINTLRSITDGRITVIFKPHTYTRTEAMWRDFCEALSLADYSIITDIFPAREEPISGITAENLARDIGRRASCCPENEIFNYLDLYTDGAIVLMGAGDYGKIRYSIVKGK